MRFPIVLALALVAVAAPAFAATITITGCDSSTLNNDTIVRDLGFCLNELAANVTTCPEACPEPLEEVGYSCTMGLVDYYATQGVFDKLGFTLAQIHARVEAIFEVCDISTAIPPSPAPSESPSVAPSPSSNSPTTSPSNTHSPPPPSSAPVNSMVVGVLAVAATVLSLM
ncbi:hypothetical protein ACKKBG_A33105 [Auxenochlorella protothecoides x Auxenochlorella symbiontica]